MTMACCRDRPIQTSKKKVTPMGNAYEIYALRYATMSPRTPHLNFLIPDPHESTAQDLDYLVWLIRRGGRDILVDTGFNAEEAKARSRKLTLNPVDALADFGVAADTIRDVIVTHLHYDHAGNLDRFPSARFHLQDREMSYATGRCMCNGMLRHPFSVEHVTTMVRHVYGERVTFHSGDGEIAPGVTVHRVGGHSDGLPVVRVEPARGPVVLACDGADGADVAGSVADVITQCELLFLCLPSAKHVRAVFEGDGIFKNIRSGQVVVDLGTSSVSQTRDFAGRLQAKGASWADAPIARTRQAAQDGTLSVMVGAKPALYADIEPLIRCFATDVTHCGEVGAGQVTKILNNMVLFETVNALAEAVAVAKHNGVDPKLLLDTLSKGSADSFALRNHGMKAIVPGHFPERAFSTEYALKDLSYGAGTGG